MLRLKLKIWWAIILTAVGTAIGILLQMRSAGRKAAHARKLLDAAEKEAQQKYSHSKEVAHKLSVKAAEAAADVLDDHSKVVRRQAQVTKKVADLLLDVRDFRNRWRMNDDHGKAGDSGSGASGNGAGGGA